MMKRSRQVACGVLVPFALQPTLAETVQQGVPCLDNPIYLSKEGLSCTKYAKINCYGQLGFNDAEVNDLLRNCPKSCHVSECADIGVNQLGDQNLSYESEACVAGWDPACQDNPEYRAPFWGECSLFKGMECMGFVSAGATEEEVLDLIKNCPCSCGIECGSRSPSSAPSAMPSNSHSDGPSWLSLTPSSISSVQPSMEASEHPSVTPTIASSYAPSASHLPTAQPSRPPTDIPSMIYSDRPSKISTSEPSSPPSVSPSIKPSGAPTSNPSSGPTYIPSLDPSIFPTLYLTATPSSAPTETPSQLPSLAPTVVVPVACFGSWDDFCPDAVAYRSLNLQLTCDNHITLECSGYGAIGWSEEEFLELVFQCPCSCRRACSTISSSPSNVHSLSPSIAPSAFGSVRPSSHASSIPTLDPSVWPSATPSSHPSETPTTEPSGAPSIVPSRKPSLQPSHQPSIEPSKAISHDPSISFFPSVHPSMAPTRSPAPSLHQSDLPTVSPAPSESTPPTFRACHNGWDPICQDDLSYRSPKLQLKCESVSQVKCDAFAFFGWSEDEVFELIARCPCSCRIECGTYSAPPSIALSSYPSSLPSSTHSDIPSISPTVLSSGAPSNMHSSQPSLLHSEKPSLKPSSSFQPSSLPSSVPSSMPSSAPTAFPSGAPSLLPSISPSFLPSSIPSNTPSSSPTTILSGAPSSMHSSEPSFSLLPSSMSSGKPSLSPSTSLQPSVRPSMSQQPTLTMSTQPSLAPSISFEPTVDNKNVTAISGRIDTKGRGGKTKAEPLAIVIIFAGGFAGVVIMLFTLYFRRGRGYKCHRGVRNSGEGMVGSKTGPEARLSKRRRGRKKSRHSKEKEMLADFILAMDDEAFAEFVREHSIQIAEGLRSVHPDITIPQEMDERLFSEFVKCHSADVAEGLMRVHPDIEVCWANKLTFSDDVTIVSSASLKQEAASRSRALPTSKDPFCASRFVEYSCCGMLGDGTFPRTKGLKTLEVFSSSVMRVRSPRLIKSLSSVGSTALSRTFDSIDGGFHDNSETRNLETESGSGSPIRLIAFPRAKSDADMTKISTASNTLSTASSIAGDVTRIMRKGPDIEVMTPICQDEGVSTSSDDEVSTVMPLY